MTFGSGSATRGPGSGASPVSGVATGRGGGAPLCVLVIDDSPTARVAMMEVLAAAGYLCTGLPSAIGATRALMKSPFVAVVADVSMPGLSGDKLVGVLRRNPRFAGLAIVLVSGTNEADLAQIQREQDVDATVAKHDIKTHLVSALRFAVQRRGGAAIASGG